MRRILFLDFDGVLTTPATLRHGVWWFTPACINRLNAIIERTSADIVISSRSWRQDYALSELRAVLAAEGFRHCDKIIDVTPRANGYRGDEIRAWLDERVEDDVICILDDDIDMGEFRPHLVQTNWMTGLTDADVDHVVSMLGATGTWRKGWKSKRQTAEKYRRRKQ